MNSYLIWIPSVQDYKRFYEFTTTHQKKLSKLAEDDLEFIYALNEILSELSMEDISIDKLTLIDKYIICVYLRMICIDTRLPLNISCPKCGAEFEESLDINQIIENNIEVLDKNYNRIIESDSFKLECDIPLIGNEYELLKTLHTKQLDQNSIENLYTYYTFSHINNIQIKDEKIELSEFDIEERTQILKTIPLKTIQKIQKEFVEPLSKIFNPTILDLPCPTDKCDPFKFNLNLTNINDIIKLMFQESPVDVLREIYYLSKFSHIDSFYVETLTPKERTTMLKFIKEEQKAQEEAQKGDPNKTMINMDSHGFDMEESPNNEFGF